MRTSQRITRLTTGQQYVFRIKAVNKFGVSDSLESEPISACHPFKQPGPPIQIIPIEVTNHTVLLEWQTPASDGGSAILG